MEANELLPFLKDAESRIKALQNEIDSIKQEANARVIEVLSRTDEPLRRELASSVYWFFDGLILAGSLEQIALVPKSQLVERYLLAASIKIPCKQCSSPVEVQLSSRTEYKTYQGKQRREVVCGACQLHEKQKQEEAEQERERHRQQRADRLYILRTMPYSAYLNTPEWKERRLHKLKRAGFRCELCHCDGKLNVHHKTYERRGDESDTDLIVLCSNCHAKFHDKLAE